MKLFKHLAAATCMAAIAGPALALSCVPPDVARTYEDLHAAPETYMVIHGTLTFDESKLPEADLENQFDNPPITKLSARLKGQALSHNGFKTPFDKTISLDVLCLGPWCAGGQSGMNIMAFVERNASGYTLTLGPCYSMVFEPTVQNLEQAESCMRGAECIPRDY